MSRSLLVLLTLAAVVCPRAQAQLPGVVAAETPGGGAGEVIGDDPLHSRAAAQRQRQVQRSEPRELAQEFHDAIVNAEELLRESVRGGGVVSLDVVVGLSSKLLAADLALATDRAERLAALERHRALARYVEEHIRSFILGSVRQFTTSDYVETRTRRLLAEVRLIQERGAGGAAPVTGTGLFRDLDPLAAGAVARDKFEAYRATTAALAPAARDAPAQAVAAGFEAIRGGRNFAIDVLFSLSELRVEVHRALGDRPADDLAVLEAHWLMAWELDMTKRSRAEAVQQFTVPDVYAAHDRRLEAESWLAAALSRPAKPLPLAGVLQDPVFIDHDPLRSQAAARAKASAARADTRQLAAQRREVLLKEYRRRWEYLLGGYDIAHDRILELSRRLLEVERSLAGSRAVRLAAFERHWARTIAVEELVKRRVEAGVKQFTAALYFEARAERHQAGVWLSEAVRAKD
jgi:hypothetical protein